MQQVLSLRADLGSSACLFQRGLTLRHLSAKNLSVHLSLHTPTHTPTHTHGWKGPRTVRVGTGVPAVTAAQKDSRPGVAWATLVEAIVIQYGHVGLLEKSLQALSCRLKKNHPA